MTLNYSYLIGEATEDRSWLKEAMIVSGASLIISLFAPVSFPLWFSPVPVATQLHVVLLLSCLLGSKRAVLAVLTFLFQGAMGLPVFAGGKGGIFALLGPSGGFLIGYIVSAFVTGFLMERVSCRSPLRTFAAMGMGNGVVYFFGLPWLAHFIGWENTLLCGLYPFIFLDLSKLIIATRFLKSLRYFNT